jgi:hypothetical protein
MAWLDGRAAALLCLGLGLIEIVLPSGLDRHVESSDGLLLSTCIAILVAAAVLAWKLRL